MVKAIMVIMDTWVTSSLASVMKPQPILPKGQGYWCHIKNISIGITERKKEEVQLLYRFCKSWNCLDFWMDFGKKTLFWKILFWNPSEILQEF